MISEHVKYLACPSCSGDIFLSTVTEKDNERVHTGTLECSKCHADFPIIRYIPRFVSVENYASGFGMQWTKHYNTQYDSFTGLPLSSRRFFEETGWGKELQGEVILEAGSGSGRFTEHAASTGAFVISFDYSYAVEANYRHNGQRNNVLIVQADVLSAPVKRGVVDKLFCFGMLQHTPDPKKSFFALPNYIRPGGELVIDSYKKNEFGKFFSFTPAPPTKYYVRPLTTRIKPSLLYNLIVTYTNLMWFITGLIGSIPKIGRNINWMLLISDHRNLEIQDGVARQWAYLNTFDMLAPKYDLPQTINTIRNWFSEAGLVDSRVRFGYNGIEGFGRNPEE